MDFSPQEGPYLFSHTLRCIEQTTTAAAASPSREYSSEERMRYIKGRLPDKSGKLLHEDLVSALLNVLDVGHLYALEFPSPKGDVYENIKVRCLACEEDVGRVSCG